MDGYAARLTSVDLPEEGLVERLTTESPQSRGLVVAVLAAKGATASKLSGFGGARETLLG